jgi:multidrug efflux pump subunit AcrA (membrane-fusion protein)
MLNISENSIREKVHTERYTSFRMTSSLRLARLFKRFLMVLTVITIAVMFMPWTQNVQGPGKVTALRPESRPQTLQSPIPGRIDRWFVREGDTVNQGDTLVFIGEIKDEYFDPNMVLRLQEELASKEVSAENYAQKVTAQQQQVTALRQNQVVKMQQARLRILSDSADVFSAEIGYKNAYIQYLRADSLYAEGIKSKFEVEQRLTRYQESFAKLTSARNKYIQSQQELNAITADYAEKIGKAQSDMFSAESDRQASLGEVAKLRNKIASVQTRQGYYYITSPQQALVTKTVITGIGETIDEGEAIVELLPLDYRIAAEIFVRPVDLPLVHIGNKARLEFDGWPAIVFSGWPNTSFGTFSAEVVAVDNVLNTEVGGYRVLLVGDDENRAWPEQLRFGSGVNCIMLLNDVPVWYEIWRQLNGFPPEYYASYQTDEAKK